jgi:uncharacterized protein DUF4270
MLTRSFMIQYFKEFMDKNTTNQMPKKLTQLFLGVIPILILLITFSCEEDPSSLGSEILPGDTKLIQNDSSLRIIGTVHDNKPMHTTNLNYYNIGIHEDEYFGSFKGEFAAQYYLSSSIDQVEDIIVDSAVLYLSIDSIYGLTNIDDIYFNIYELNEDLLLDSVYYSNSEIDDYYTNEIPININSIISGDSLLKFNLTNTFANKLISSGNEVYDSAALFRDVFKGISIIPELINSPGGLITANMASTESKIVLYYQTGEEDSLKTNFSLSNRFAKYTNDYSSGIVNDYINNTPNENDSLIFVQGLNGIKSKLTFENINEWKDQDSTYSILNAELTIPIADYDYNGFYPPEKIFFYFADADTDGDSTLVEIEDYSSPDLFNGTYDDASKIYTFNIPKHLMRVLNNSIEDSCLNFTVYNKSFFPNRVILESGNHIKLNVTYTKH